MGFKDIACATKPYKQRFSIKVYSDSSKRLPEMKRESKHYRRCTNFTSLLSVCQKDKLITLENFDTTVHQPGFWAGPQKYYPVA
jgi:hypothetical protein